MTSRQIPLPPAGALELVSETSETVFNWDYALDREALVNLYEKGKRMQWNASTDVDWSTGDGPEVAGPAMSLILAMVGRAKALDDCTGDGVELLRSRA